MLAAMGTGTFGIWHILFMLAAYSSAIVCLYATYRIGQEQGWRWGVIHLLLLCGFLALYFLMESWAASRTPYFSYPPYCPPPYCPPTPKGFPDWIPFLKFVAKPPKKLCEIGVSPNLGIPLSVLLLEATLTFAAMHTARLLANAKDLSFRLLRPFMAALALLTLDFFLDPLASTSSTCLKAGGPAYSGLGFWEWYVLPDLGPDAFGVPLFNYVLWYSAPLAMVAIVGLLGWFYDSFLVPLVVVGTLIKLQVLIEGAFLTLIVFAFTLIIMMSPNFAYLPIGQLRAIFVGVLLATLLAILYYARFFKYDNDFRWWFVYPQAVFLLFCVVAFLFSGLVSTKLPGLWIVVLVVSPLFLLWTLSPYLKKIWP